MSATDEQVSQFLAFTGSSDASKAHSYLEMSGGNLETAVSLYMEHETPGGTTVEPEIRAPDATRTERLMDVGGGGGGGGGFFGGGGSGYGMLDPSLQMMNQLMEEQLASSAFAAPVPARQRVSARDALDQAIAVDGDELMADAAATENNDDDDDEEEDYQYEDGGSDDDVQIIYNPTLSDMFAAPTHLMHKAGGFQGARAMAKDTKRWLLVNIQKDSEFASHALNRDVWRDELVENLVREGFIFWQQFDISPEGRTYIERYKVHQFPHVGIVDPRTGRLLWSKEGWTQQKPLTAESFVELIMDFCSRNSFDKPPALPKVGNQSVGKRSMAEISEDEQLHAAMQASIKYMTKPAEEPAAAAAAPEEDSKPAAKKEPSMLDYLLEMSLPDEPAKGPRIQFRMPDGKRVVRRFDSADTVQTIYAFVAQSVENAKNGKEFVLMAGFPPKDLISDLDKTVEECKLSGEAITIRWKE